LQLRNNAVVVVVVSVSATQACCLHKYWKIILIESSFPSIVRSFVHSLSYYIDQQAFSEYLFWLCFAFFLSLNEARRRDEWNEKRVKLHSNRRKHLFHNQHQAATTTTTGGDGEARRRKKTKYL